MKKYLNIFQNKNFCLIALLKIVELQLKTTRYFKRNNNVFIHVISKIKLSTHSL